MNISTSKLESTMVSMAGTLIYLRDMTATLVKKPVVPKAVAPVMTATQGELAVLEVQFEATRRAAVADAQPFLDEWLKRTGLEVGGIFRGRTSRAFTHGPELQVSGGIEAARLYNHLVNGIRVVDITLVDARITSLFGLGAVVDDIPVKEQASYNLVALRDFDVADETAGTSSKVLHVRIPIQESERKDWARSGNLSL
jgi:hypothetical protein